MTWCAGASVISPPPTGDHWGSTLLGSSRRRTLFFNPSDSILMITSPRGGSDCRRCGCFTRAQSHSPTTSSCAHHFRFIFFCKQSRITYKHDHIRKIRRSRTFKRVTRKYVGIRVKMKSLVVSILQCSRHMSEHLPWPAGASPRRHAAPRPLPLSPGAFVTSQSHPATTSFALVAERAHLFTLALRCKSDL